MRESKFLKIFISNYLKNYLTMNYIFILAQIDLQSVRWQLKRFFLLL